MSIPFFNGLRQHFPKKQAQPEFSFQKPVANPPPEFGSEGGEFLDDAIRMTEQPLSKDTVEKTKTNKGHTEYFW